MGDNICYDVTNEGLISKIYKHLMQLNTKKAKQPNQKQTFLQRRHQIRSDQISRSVVSNSCGLMNCSTPGHLILCRPLLLLPPVPPSRHMKRFSTSLIVREMKIKTTMRYHLIPVRMAIVRKFIKNKCWQGCVEKGTLLHGWWDYKLVHPLWRTTWSFLKKLEIKLPWKSLSRVWLFIILWTIQSMEFSRPEYWRG